MRVLGLVSVLLLTACGGGSVPAHSRPKEKPPDQNKQVTALFQKVFEQRVARSPMFQTYLGIKKDYGKWDDISDERAAKTCWCADGAIFRRPRSSDGCSDPFWAPGS